ncbi:MAG: hypothetical protein WAV95_20270 [Azonexus sp.]
MTKAARRFPLLTALWLACSTPAWAEIELAEWLFYSMYPGDTAHSVHLSAQRLRPDGLLESASRYPRHGDESWTAEEARAGWYNYTPRLIDCATGFSIETGDELLDANGKRIAHRDSAARSLADWKDQLANKLSGHSWPSNNEFFLACAGYADQTLQSKRRQLMQTTPPRLSYKPLIASLRTDSTALFEKQAWRYAIDLRTKDFPATPGDLFDTVTRHYEAWSGAFLANPKPASTAPQAGLSEAVRRWLSDQGADVEDVSSRGDGTLTYVDRQPKTTDIPYELLEQRPAAAAAASKAKLRVRVDCRSGVQLAQSLEWLDESDHRLAKQSLPARILAQELNQQTANRRDPPTGILTPPDMYDVPQTVCRAAAAQCTDSLPGKAQPFALSAEEATTIKQAGSAAEALLALRTAYRNYRQRFVPSCRIGTHD